MMDVFKFWQAVLAQDAEEIRSYFAPNAYVNWHCTNEQFSVDEFIRANCEYPGDWDGEVERVVTVGDAIVTAVRVYPKDKSSSFHVTSFIMVKNDLIASLDEYWADDGDAPQWRQNMKIGKRITDR